MVGGAGLKAVPDGDVGVARIIVPKTVSTASPPGPGQLAAGAG